MILFYKVFLRFQNHRYIIYILSASFRVEYVAGRGTLHFKCIGTHNYPGSLSIRNAAVKQFMAKIGWVMESIYAPIVKSSAAASNGFSIGGGGVIGVKY